MRLSVIVSALVAVLVGLGARLPSCFPQRRPLARLSETSSWMYALSVDDGDHRRVESVAPHPGGNSVVHLAQL